MVFIKQIHVSRLFSVEGGFTISNRVSTVPMFLKPPYLKRVGVYCRISSTTRAQLSSLSAQASFLSKYAIAKPGWLFTDIYLDVGSGADTQNRLEYNRMIADAKDGVIDIILVKSISRFGRDTEEILFTVRALKSYGVTVFFEEQGIDTSSMDSELYITLYAAVAQAENYNHSENVKWGIRRRLEDGTSSIYDRPCYGYENASDGTLIIRTQEAAVVRRIFNTYLSGFSVVKIKAMLEKESIPSPSGKPSWSKRTIELILTNKKYCGYSEAYKSYLTGEPKTKRKINKGEHFMLEFAHHHEAIIPLDIFTRVEQEKQRRSNIVMDADGIPKRKSTKYSAKNVNEVITESTEPADN